jgi:hypothetical protein
MPDDEKLSLTGSALLQTLSQKLSQRQRKAPELFRVVEIVRDSRGRLSPQGQIWHTDLEHVRRFGRAVAANSVSQGVLIADTQGGVVEKIPVQPLGGAASGWGDGWRAMPLPPAPPRQKPRVPPRSLVEKARSVAADAPALPAPGDVPTLSPAAVSTAAPRPADIPVVAQPAFDPESTATLTPAPPPEPAQASASPDADSPLIGDDGGALSLP